MKNINKKKLGMILLWISIILLFSMMVLLVISLFSTKLITKTLRYCVIVGMILAIIILAEAIMLLAKNKHIVNFKRWIRILVSILSGIYATGCCGFLFLLYGPNHGFRDWLITTAMMTMNHQYYCKWFYNDEIIAYVLRNNFVGEFSEDTDTSLVDFNFEDKNANEYVKEILNHDKDDIYKIVQFKVNGCDAYMAAIYDPSKIHLAVTPWLGRSGAYAYDMAEDSHAVIAINGGGFIDPGYNTKGENPLGVTIQNGKIITDGTSGSSGGVIGFDKNNILILSKNTGAKAAIDMGYRDAVSMMPFLIVNGKPAFIKGNGGWGYAARTAIGQRADGIVLFLVIDSNEFRSKGASMLDLTEIMQRYGAINAANLDGGTSSVMVLPKNEASKYTTMCEDENLNYCWINDPIDSAMRHRSRGIPTAWVVTE